MSGDLFFSASNPHFLANTSVAGTGEIKQLEEMMYRGQYNIQVVGTDGKSYSLYNCHITSISQHFSKTALVATVMITFKLAVRQDAFDIMYKSCSFTFPSIEKIFPLTPFHVSLPNSDGNNLTIEKKLEVCESKEITPSFSFKAESSYDGISSSDKQFDISIKQSKYIYLDFNQDMALKDIIDTVRLVKEYFELIYRSEIHIFDISLNYEDLMRGDKILFSDFDCIEVVSHPNAGFQFRGGYDEIVSGLIGWCKYYDQFKIGISIWQKQIYNTRVDREDSILWNGQAIEALCEHHSELYGIAKAIAVERAQKDGQKPREPNLIDYLTAVNKQFPELGETFVRFFADAKKVRDKLTHNNPNKQVTERQIKNTVALLEHFSTRLISYIIGLKGIIRGCVLIPLESDS
jgi:hypothetical protein